MHFICKDGWPLEIELPWRRHWLSNIIRIMIHARKIKRGGYDVPLPHDSMVNIHGPQGD